MLVDDNDITRAGFAAVLGSSSDVDLIAATDHRGSLNLAAEWETVDVVVVDAADEDRSGDQFPGVEVVRHIRASSAEARPIIIVITGHFMHDGLRYRMAEAGADFYFFRGNLRSGEELLDVVLHSEEYRRGVPPVANPEHQRLLGVREGTDVDGLLSYIGEHELGAAVDEVKPVRDEPGSRRWRNHRKRMAEAGAIQAINISTGDTPYRGQKDPSWRQLRGIYAWAARVRQVDDGLGKGDA